MHCLTKQISKLVLLF